MISLGEGNSPPSDTNISAMSGGMFPLRRESRLLIRRPHLSVMACSRNSGSGVMSTDTLYGLGLEPRTLAVTLPSSMSISFTAPSRR